jgi:SAM-dependent methyltransferase
VAEEKSYGLGLSNDWSDESRRLAAVELLFDAATFRCLDSLGVSPGMRCLELGGGGGSVARWIADRVGPTGSVLVTDIDIEGLVGCDRPNIEVRLHDVCTDPLDEASFDFIHARLLLEHLPSRVEVIDKLVSALRPGSWLLLEDLDFTGLIHLAEEHLLVEPQNVRGLYQRATRAAADAGRSAGWSGEFARRLPVHLMNAGLEAIGAETHEPLMLGGSPESAFFTLSLKQLQSLFVSNGSLSAEEVALLIDTFETPGAMCSGYSMVSAWGRRPT